MTWQLLAGAWVLLPPRPRALIHFIGGAFIGATPHNTYGRLLEALAKQGYGIIATPFETVTAQLVIVTDHYGVVKDIEDQFETARSQLQKSQRLKRFLPVYGLGHSMGCKLHLLLNSLSNTERAGNILISFNNERAEQAIPFAKNIPLDQPITFTPDPQTTRHLIQTQYPTRRNLLIKFAQDDLDQTLSLAQLLEAQFPGMIVVQHLTGNHLTPMGPDFKWSIGETFTPLDALGQWIQQGVSRDLNQLVQAILRWLEPAQLRAYRN